MQDKLEKKRLMSDIKETIKAQEAHDAQKNKIIKQKKLEENKANKKDKQMKEERKDMYFGLLKEIQKEYQLKELNVQDFVVIS